jgi:hypothetical protein
MTEALEPVSGDEHVDPMTKPINRSGKGGRSLGHWSVFGASGVGVLALLALRLIATPDERGYGTHEQLGLPDCLMMEVTGVPCPGCGVTTSVTLFVHGRFLDSFLTQPFGLIVVVLIPLFVVWSLWGHARGADLYENLTSKSAKRWIVPGVIAMGAAWIYKLVVMFG